MVGVVREGVWFVAGVDLECCGCVGGWDGCFDGWDGCFDGRDGCVVGRDGCVVGGGGAGREGFEG